MSVEALGSAPERLYGASAVDEALGKDLHLSQILGESLADDL